MNNRYPQELYPTVEKTLQRDVKARNSDVYLYKVILNEFYGTTDISKIVLDGDIFASIKRARQKVQESNPFLGPCKEVKEYRAQSEQTYLNFVRNY